MDILFDCENLQNLTILKIFFVFGLVWKVEETDEMFPPDAPLWIEGEIAVG